MTADLSRAKFGSGEKAYFIHLNHQPWRLHWGVQNIVRGVIFLGAIAVATGVFLPFVQLNIGGFGFGKTSSLSLYGAVNETLFIESAFARADTTLSEKFTGGYLAVLNDHAPRSVTSLWSDTKSTLNDVKTAQKTAQSGTIGTILQVAGWIFLGLIALVMWLLLKTISSGRTSRRREIFIAVVMFFVAVIGVGAYFGGSAGIEAANAEVGKTLLVLGAGAYLMMFGGALGFVAAMAAIWIRPKPREKTTLATTPAPAPTQPTEIGLPPAPQDENRSSLPSE